MYIIILTFIQNSTITRVFLNRIPSFFIPFSISFQYSYVAKSLVLIGFIQYPTQYTFNNKSILFTFFFTSYLNHFLSSIMAELYSNFEKTMKKQPKKARKTVILEPKNYENGGL